MKKSIAILLFLTMLVTGLTTMYPVYAAASGPGLETVRGAAYFKPNINDEGVSDFYYSDNLFKSDSLYYDPSLASASVALCGSSLMSTSRSAVRRCMKGEPCRTSTNQGGSGQARPRDSFHAYELHQIGRAHV